MISERMVCPVCLSGHFAWDIRETHLGDVHRYVRDDGTPSFHTETLDRGDHLDPIDEGTVFCVGCGEDREYDTLVVEGSNRLIRHGTRDEVSE